MYFIWLYHSKLVCIKSLSIPKQLSCCLITTVRMCRKEFVPISWEKRGNQTVFGMIGNWWKQKVGNPCQQFFSDPDQIIETFILWPAHHEKILSFTLVYLLFIWKPVFQLLSTLKLTKHNKTGFFCQNKMIFMLTEYLCFCKSNRFWFSSIPLFFLIPIYVLRTKNYLKGTIDFHTKNASWDDTS